MLWGMRPIRAAESPVVAQESRSLNGAKQRAGRLVRQLRLDEDQRALACTAVDHFADAGLPGDVTLGRQATVQCYLLLAMANAQPVYAQRWFVHPEYRLRDDTSSERRVGKECASTVRSRESPI